MKKVNFKKLFNRGDFIYFTHFFSEADHSIGGLDQAINCDTSGTGSVVGVMSDGAQPSATVIDDTCAGVSTDSTKPSHGIPPQKSNKVYPQFADSRQG